MTTTTKPYKSTPLTGDLVYWDRLAAAHEAASLIPDAAERSQRVHELVEARLALRDYHQAGSAERKADKLAQFNELVP